MKYERMILVAFFLNYVINEVVSGVSALVPVSADGSGWVSYIVFTLLAGGLVAFFAWWYIKTSPGVDAMRTGLTFGILGVSVSLLTTFVSGVFGTLFDTGSFSAILDVLPNFPAYLWDISTHVLMGYWIVPAFIVGWFMGRGNASTSAPAPAPTPAMAQ